jgi:hypothetical protein
LTDGASSSSKSDNKILTKHFKGKEMNKDLNLLNIIRLETELENAIGNRDAFLCGGDWNMVNMWDEQIENIIEEIINLGIL